MKLPRDRSSQASGPQSPRGPAGAPGQLLPLALLPCNYCPSCSPTSSSSSFTLVCFVCFHLLADVCSEPRRPLTHACTRVAPRSTWGVGDARRVSLLFLLPLLLPVPGLQAWALVTPVPSQQHSCLRAGKSRQLCLSAQKTDVVDFIASSSPQNSRLPG